MDVMIVDDSRTTRAVIRGVLEALGHHVVAEAANGATALKIVVTARPDIVLLDLELPDMSGVDVAREVMEIAPTPMVVVSSHEEEALFDRAASAGVHYYLTKPFRNQDLQRAIVIARARFEDAIAIRQLQVVAERRSSRLSLAHEIAQRLAGTSLTDPHVYQNLLQDVAQRISEGFGYQQVEIGVVVDETLVVSTSVGPISSEESPFRRLSLDGLGIFPWVAREGKSELIHNIREHPFFLAGEFHEDVCAILAVPLRTREHVMGVLNVQSASCDELQASDLEIIELLAGHLASVLDNTRLVSELQAQGRQLAQTNQWLREAQKQIVKNERLAAIGQTAAAVQHEINNPLTSVLGNAQWLLRREDLPQEVIDVLLVIERQSMRIRDVVRRLGSAEDRLTRYVGETQMIDLMNETNDEKTLSPTPPENA